MRMTRRDLYHFAAMFLVVLLAVAVVASWGSPSEPPPAPCTCALADDATVLWDESRVLSTE